MQELIAQQEAHEASLNKARKEVASAQKQVLKQEKMVKSKEKEVADKVSNLVLFSTQHDACGN